MKGALLALKIYCKDIYRASLHFKTDKTATIVQINKQAAPSK